VAVKEMRDKVHDEVRVDVHGGYHAIAGLFVIIWR
jgi:hypothetical protein